MKSELNAKQLLGSLKDILRQKKVTYSDLSKKLKVSLPTVKRWLNSPNLSIGELLQVCELVGITLKDLVAYSDNFFEKPFRFTIEQETFLASHPNYLAYFYELKNQVSPVKIEKKYQLSRASTKKYLRDLARIGLLKDDATIDSAKVVATASVVWDDYGPLGQVFSKEMLRLLTDRMLKQYGQNKDAFLSLWGRHLTQENLKDLKDDFYKIEEKYRKLSEFNKKVLPLESLSQISCAVILDQWDPQVFTEIPNLETPYKRSQSPTLQV